MTRKPASSILWTAFKLCLAFLMLSGCERSPEFQRHDISGETMGTYYSLSLIDRPDSQIEPHAQAVDEILENINSMMSTYLVDSQISQFNRLESADWFDVSADLVMVSQSALDIYVQTRGSFDPTIAPLVNLWSFGPDQRPLTIPEQHELEAIADRMGAEKIEIRGEPPALRKSHPLVELDLSAIAKGFAVDEIAEYLLSQGKQNFLIDIGGELRASGTNLTGENWRVGIEKPLSHTTQSIQQVVSISGKSIATSGSYRNYFEQDNKRYSHIINPQTGLPIEHKLVSVSVIGDNCMLSDAYATALMVLGPDRGYDFALQYGLAVYMIEKNGDDYVSKFTPQMEPYLE